MFIYIYKDLPFFRALFYDLKIPELSIGLWKPLVSVKFLALTIVISHAFLR